MNFCSNCGKELKPEENFCPNCGKNIKNGENTNEPVREIDKVEKSLNTISAEKTPHEEKQSGLHCPYCKSDKVHVQVVAKNQNPGCLMVFLYIFLAITLVGIPIMILIILLTGKKTVTKKVYTCDNCGRMFNDQILRRR